MCSNAELETVIQYVQFYAVYVVTVTIFVCNIGANVWSKKLKTLPTFYQISEYKCPTREDHLYDYYKIFKCCSYDLYYCSAVNILGIQSSVLGLGG